MILQFLFNNNNMSVKCDIWLELSKHLKVFFRSPFALRRHLLAMPREKDVYFAKLAEQAERYDEMADYMKAVGDDGNELSVEERNLLSVAYKNTVGSRRAAWRIISSVEQKEKSKGNDGQAGYAKDYRVKVENELQKICDTILTLLDTGLIPKATQAESKVFYQKMKADYYRYIAEFRSGEEKTKAAEEARKAYAEAAKVAKDDLAVTHPIRLGLALNYSVFMYEVLNDPDEACKMARTAFEDRKGGKDGKGQRNFRNAKQASNRRWACDHHSLCHCAFCEPYQTIASTGYPRKFTKQIYTYIYIYMNVHGWICFKKPLGWGCHCRAGQRCRRFLQGFDVDHAAVARQLDPLDFGPGSGKLSTRIAQWYSAKMCQR